MRVRAASVVVAFLFTVGGPAHAQGPGQAPPNYQQLVAEIANLKARVGKLEGKITAADLVGTYAASALLVGLTGGDPAGIGAGVLTGTATLAADGSASLSSTLTGYTLTQGSPWLLGTISDGGLDTSSWTYANGVVTITSSSETTNLAVAAGGRLLIGASANTDDAGLSVLNILTRLP
jgi:hypothetical protein